MLSRPFGKTRSRRRLTASTSSSTRSCRFAVAAALAGLAGSLYTYYLLHPMPMNVFAQTWLFLPILMVVLGGTGTILGSLDRRPLRLCHSLVRRQVLPRLASGHLGRHHHHGDAVHAVRSRRGWTRTSTSSGDEARAANSVRIVRLDSSARRLRWPRGTAEGLRAVSTFGCGRFHFGVGATRLQVGHAGYGRLRSRL